MCAILGMNMLVVLYCNIARARAVGANKELGYLPEISLVAKVLCVEYSLTCDETPGMPCQVSLLSVISDKVL